MRCLGFPPGNGDGFHVDGDKVISEFAFSIAVTTRMAFA